MSRTFLFVRNFLAIILLAILNSAGAQQQQQLKIKDFVLFGGFSKAYHDSNFVRIGTSGNIKGGAIGSYDSIGTQASVLINGNIYSGNTVSLQQNSTVTGNVVANNGAASNSNAVFSGISVTFGGKAYPAGGNITANGKVVINPNSVIYGAIKQPAGATYNGPTPKGGIQRGVLSLPLMPSMPVINSFTAGTGTISDPPTLVPGTYGNLTLSGGKTLTLSGPGIYIFKSIQNTGDLSKINTIKFDFSSDPTGQFKIFVEGNVNFKRIKTTILNGGSTSRIYTEVHGAGSLSSTAFSITSGTVKPSTDASNWVGTVWAPYGVIQVIGSGTNTSTTTITGALWSGKNIDLGDKIAVNYAPLQFDPNYISPYYPPPDNGKVFNIIGSELTSLSQNTDTISKKTDNNIFLIDNNKVMIEAVAQPNQYAALLTYMQNHGLTNMVNNGPNTLIITGFYPIANLTDLNTRTDLMRYCRPLYPPISNSGVALTQGDSALRSNFVRKGYNIGGAGVKVGVMSDSYNSISGDPAHTNVVNGDLPGVGNPDGDSIPVQVVKEYPFGKRTDEGRAMLQIVHDVAPKATLAFRTGFISAGDFAQGIKEMTDAGCNVLVDDITYVTEPFFKDGIVAQAVDEAVRNGVTYFSAAGNYGEKSYESTFSPVAAPAGLTGMAHDFGGGQIKQGLSLTPGSYTIVLQWIDDEYTLGTTAGTQTDLDIYLVGADGATLFGFNRSNIGGDPVEVLPFTVNTNTNASLMIVKASGSNVRFKYVIFRGEGAITNFQSGTSTIVGQANASGAIAVGAALYSNTPAYGVSIPTIASFSSRGGTKVGNVIRTKPDIVAPNGVNTTVNMGGQNIDGDAFPNFFGTSAAAPHAAAVAALLIEGKKKFTGQVLSPADIKSLLQNTAQDMGTPGYDVETGYGFIQADSAMRSFAKPTPAIYSLEVIPPTGTTSFVPGTQPFTVKVKGDFLTASTLVYFRGKPLPTTIVSPKEATAQVPVFFGNPPIQLYTAPISSSLQDGGLSNQLRFFDPVKKAIVVTADGKTKKYGENLPAFTATVTVDGQSLAISGLTLQNLKLDHLTYQTPATSSSNVGEYFIRPLSPLTTTDPTDIGLQELYTYQFKDSLLNIEKLPLKITPKNKTLTYGDKIDNIQFDYEITPTGVIGNRDSLLNTIQLSQQATLAPNALALIDSRALVNGRAIVNSDLADMSFLVSGRALVNSRALVNAKAIVNGAVETETTNIVDVATASIFNYQQDSASSPLASSRALVNSRALINSRALVNGEALVNSRALVNGTPIVNSTTVSDTSNSNVVIIIDSTDAAPSSDGIINDLQPINMITGINVGSHFIVPGAFLSENYDLSYGLGTLTINPATLTIKADDTTAICGSQPQFNYSASGFQYDDSIGNVIAGNPSFTINGTDVAGQTFSLGQYEVDAANILLTAPSDYVAAYSSGTLTVNNILHYWKADGDYTDAVGTANGTPVGDVNFGEGHIGSNSFSFNGNVGYVDAGNKGTVTGTGNFKVGAWVKTTSSNPMVIIQQRDTSINGEFILKIGGNHDTHVVNENQGKAYFLVYDDANSIIDLFSNTLVNDGQWHYIQGERMGTTVNLYVDGNLEATGNTDVVVNMNASGNIQTVIGRDIRDDASQFNGLVDDIQITQDCGTAETYQLQNRTGSITHKETIDGMAVYPNPANNRITIHSENVIGKEVTVFDIAGRPCAIKSFKKLSDNSLEMDVSHLSKGVYFIKVKDATGYKTIRFIKL